MKHRETSQRLARVVSPECALEAMVGGLVAIAHSVVVISPSGPGDRIWALSLSLSLSLCVCAGPGISRVTRDIPKQEGPDRSMPNIISSSPMTPAAIPPSTLLSQDHQ